MPKVLSRVWLPTLLFVGIPLWLEGVGRVGQPEGFLVPGWYTLPLIALLVTPLAWWRLACRGPHMARQGAWAGTVIAVILCLAPTVYLVVSTAESGPGDGFVLLAIASITMAWGVALPAGGAMGALLGWLQRAQARHATSTERAAIDAQALEVEPTVRPAHRSPLQQWLDRGTRRQVLRVTGLLSTLPLLLVAAILFICIRWKQSEIRVEVARATSPNGKWTAVSSHYGYPWGGSHHFDVRINPANQDQAAGAVVWESDRVPVSRFQWCGSDSVVVSVDVHHDEFAAGLIRTIQTHEVHGIVARTEVKLDPPFLMVSNPTKPDDLVVGSGDIHLNAHRVKDGDSTIISATIHNLGLRPALGVRVEISDDRLGIAIGKQTIDIAAGGARTIEIPWRASEPDTHSIAVRVSPYIFPEEASYTNNYAVLTVVLGREMSPDSLVDGR